MARWWPPSLCVDVMALQIAPWLAALIVWPHVVSRNVLAAMASWCFWLMVCKPVNGWRVWWLGLAGLAIFVSTSRGALAGMVVTGLVWTLLHRKRWWPLVVLAAISIPAYVALFPKTTLGLRLEMWAIAMRVWQASPWMGGGAGAWAKAWAIVDTTQPNYPHAHSIIFNTLADYGLAGLVVVVAITGAVVWRLWASPLPTARGVLFALLALGVHLLVDLPIYDLIFSTLIVTAIGLALSEQRMASNGCASSA